MATYKLENFVIPVTSEDKIVQIRDRQNVIRHSINATHVLATFNVGNLVRIKSRGNDFVIALDFRTPGEALSALQRLQIEIDKVRLTTPVAINKDIENFINTHGSGTSSNFLHHQISATTSWAVSHSLGYRPNITVTDNSFEEIEGLVKHLDVNNAYIYFNQAVAGWVIAS